MSTMQMKTITLMRMIIETLENCNSFDIEMKNHLTTIYFAFPDPLETIIWTIRKDFYKEHLSKFFELDKEKQRSVLL